MYMFGAFVLCIAAFFGATTYVQNHLMRQARDKIVWSDLLHYKNMYRLISILIATVYVIVYLYLYTAHDLRLCFVASWIAFGFSLGSFAFWTWYSLRWVRLYERLGIFSSRS